MATSTIKTLGLIALIFLLLFVQLSIAGLLGIRVPWLILPLAMLFLWIAVVLWVYRDAEQRGIDGVLWGLLVFVGNIIALLIYLIVRKEETSRPLSNTSAPGSRLCPSCRAGVQAGFAFCPHCGSTMKDECPACNKPVAIEWQRCPFCGERLARQVPQADR